MSTAIKKISLSKITQKKKEENSSSKLMEIIQRDSSSSKLGLKQINPVISSSLREKLSTASTSILKDEQPAAARVKFSASNQN